MGWFSFFDVYKKKENEKRLGIQFLLLSQDEGKWKFFPSCLYIGVSLPEDVFFVFVRKYESEKTCRSLLFVFIALRGILVRGIRSDSNYQGNKTM